MTSEKNEQIRRGKVRDLIEADKATLMASHFEEKAGFRCGELVDFVCASHEFSEAENLQPKYWQVVSVPGGGCYIAAATIEVSYQIVVPVNLYEALVAGNRKNMQLFPDMLAKLEFAGYDCEYLDSDMAGMYSTVLVSRALLNKPGFSSQALATNLKSVEKYMDTILNEHSSRNDSETIH